MKSEDEKLRELFEVKEKHTFNNNIRRAKTLTIIRTGIISLIMFIIISFIVLILNATLLSRISEKEEGEIREWFNIAMPNAYVGNTQNHDGIMVGEMNYVRYRFLGDKPITDGNYKESYTYMPLINDTYSNMENYLWNSYGESKEDIEQMRRYNKSGKRVMKFYHPSIKYEKYINDLEKLDDIGSDKVMEISLSFDKEYTMAQIQEILPKNLTLNWYWVNTINEDDMDVSSKLIFEEYDVYGIKALDEQGHEIINPENKFIKAIKDGKKKNYSETYEKLFDTLSNGKGEINIEDLKIIGVVVSGDVEKLKDLKDERYIKAATIGAVADLY